MLAKHFVTEYLQKAGVNFNGDDPADIKVEDKLIFNRSLFEPSLVAGESYMAGQWECKHIDELFFKICRYEVDQQLYRKWTKAIQKIRNIFFNLQTRRRSIAVAEQHYNLSNELYRYMLGPTMAYTCAYWKDATNLDQAQNNKFDLICKKINLKRGDKVLELGCGWGSLAKFMTENYGCQLVAVNISLEQVRYAKEVCKGLPITFYLCDYRDSSIYNPRQELFDKVVSVGLCEHIGHRNYRTFIKIARKNLKDSGLFLLHTIGKNNSIHFIDPWIHKYIFPNGILPSVKLLAEAMEDEFVIEDLHNFGADYDKTLMAWHKNFNDNWNFFKGHFEKEFFRKWNYYLLSCAGVFRARGMQLWQMVLSPKGVLGGYESIR